MNTLPPVSAAWVEGEPVLSGGRGQAEWQDAIRESLHGRVHSPALTFIVSSLRRRGHPFDLDNLVHPVLMVLEEPIDCVSARLYVGDQPGLLIQDLSPQPPPGDPVRRLYVDTHSEMSDRHRSGIPEIVNDSVLDQHEGIGLMLEFDRDDVPIRRGWFGPTESVVDDLAPWLGRYTSRQLVADHRIRDLRFVRGLDPARRGVRISIWYVPDEMIAVPGEIESRIRRSG